MKKKAKVTSKHEMVFNIKSTKEVNNELIIEGYANPTTVDRGREIMPMDCWRLDNYKKTGVILFNHDRDEPIGKAIEVKPTPEGLYLKARISKSKHPDIMKIRDMIRERILNAFSVGFMENDSYMTPEGVKVITEADLFEVSVVTVPMNQDATFEITSKQLKKLSYDDIAEKVLHFKGAEEAIEVRAKAHAIGLSTEDVVKRLSDEFKMRRQEAWDLMSGNKAMNEAEKKAIADMLGGKKKKPKPEEAEAANADETAPKFGKKPSEGGKKPVDAAAEGEQDPENPFAKKDDEAGEKPTDSPLNGETDGEPMIENAPLKKHSLPVPSVHAVLVPTSTAETAELAKEVALAYGLTGIEEPIEEADGWIIIVRAEEDFMGELATMTIGDGVLGLIGVLAPEHSSKNDTGEAGPGEQGSDNLPQKDESENDMNKDVANNEPSEEQGTEADANKPIDDSDDSTAQPETEEETEDQKNPKKGQIKKHFDSDVSQVESGDNPEYRPQWAINAKAWDKAKAASLAELGKLSYAFIVTQYTKELRANSGSKTKGGPIDGYGGTENDQNPIQESSKQTHILLGALIAEIQGLRGDIREQTNVLQSPKTSSEPAAPLYEAPIVDSGYDPVMVKGLEERLRTLTDGIHVKMKILGVD